MGDWDGDEKLDLAVVNDEDQGTQIYRNAGFAFILAETLPEGGSGYDVAWGDVDNDGDMDLAVARAFTQSLVYCNNGGVFTSTVVSSTIEPTYSVAWACYSSDGNGQGLHLERE